MLPEPYKDGGLEISRAIEDKDYIITEGILKFEAAKVRLVIDKWMADRPTSKSLGTVVQIWISL